MRLRDGGADPASIVDDEEGAKHPTDWSSDGRWILYHSPQAGPRNLTLWVVPVRPKGQRDKPQPYLANAFYSDCAAYFAPAPAGQPPQWIAHMTNDTGTGRFEVYVRDFPSGRQKSQVSNEGGWLPHWRRDGRELFYVTYDGTLMAVPVSTGATFEHEIPRPLFRAGLRQPMAAWPNVYAVGRDGDRFLVNQRLADPAAEAITVVLPGDRNSL